MGQFASLFMRLRQGRFQLRTREGEKRSEGSTSPSPFPLLLLPPFPLSPTSRALSLSLHALRTGRVNGTRQRLRDYAEDVYGSSRVGEMFSLAVSKRMGKSK